MMMLMQLVLSVLTLVNGYPQYTKSSEDQIAAATDDSERQDNGGGGEVIYAADSQHFYPSFAPFHHPPLGHSRPFYQQEGAYSHRPTAYQQHVGFDSVARFSGYKGEQATSGNSDSSGILGSGNFGVIRGGTFYGENDDAESVDQYNYYNGHGRPSFYFGGNPRPRQYQQFENFRDFADINVPTNPAYSQYVIVYANKNGSKFDPGQRGTPKNIIEHLALLDLEDDGKEAKKLSKSKRKLAELSNDKKSFRKKDAVKSQRSDEDTATSSAELHEPLLALS